MAKRDYDLAGHFDETLSRNGRRRVWERYWEKCLLAFSSVEKLAENQWPGANHDSAATDDSGFVDIEMANRRFLRNPIGLGVSCSKMTGTARWPSNRVLDPWPWRPASQGATIAPVGEGAQRRATYDDLAGVPDNLVGELIAGELHTQPRPSSLHAQATSTLGEELGPPFKRGKGGPGGWILLDEPELHLGSDVLVPDLAGWRRTTMPELPDVAHFETRPDWICETLSPATRRHDRVRKLPIYAARGVAHVWLVDPEPQTLEVYRLDGETYRLLATHAGDSRVRAEPFDAIELDLGALWMR